MANLGDFAELIRRANEEKRERLLAEEAHRKDVVAPLLSELFSTVVKAKQDPSYVPTIVETVKLKPAPIRIKEVHPVVDKITTLEEKLEITNKKIDTMEKSPDIEKKFTGMISRLENELKNLKRHVDSKPTRTIVNNVSSGGGGEVKILRMDDIDKANLQDGATLVWDESIKKFKLVVPTEPPTLPPGLVANLSGGAPNQVLVKASGTDYDYEWQDMIVNIPVYTRLIDRIDDTLMYIGESIPGSGVCEPKWRIKQIKQVGIDISIIWANGSSDFSKVWDDRLSLLYSVECTPIVITGSYDSGSYNAGPYNGTPVTNGTYNSGSYNAGNYNGAITGGTYNSGPFNVGPFNN